MSFDGPTGVWSDFDTGTPATYQDILVANCTFKDSYYHLWISENVNGLKVVNSRFLGGWMGFFLWNQNRSNGTTTNRVTNDVRIENSLFYDQGVKGMYFERGNNVTIANTSVINCGNRSGRSLPTNDPRGLERTGNGNVGNGIDVNLCGSGPVSNFNMFNVTVANCASRDRQVASDPLEPGQDPTLAIGAGVSIKGRIFRGGSSINGLNIVNCTFTGNKVALAFPHTDLTQPGTVGVNKGNVINNARLVNNNFYNNRVRAINPESGSFPGAAAHVFGSPTDVASYMGYPTSGGGWNTTGMVPMLIQGSYFGSVNGPASLGGSPYAGSGGALSDGYTVASIVGGNIATLLGRPIDLAGSYLGPSSGPVGGSSQPGRSGAATGTLLTGGQTFEMSGTNTFGANAVSGTFQPFAEATGKAPRQVVLPNPVNSTTLTAEVHLNSPSLWNTWSWSPATGDTFTVGVGNALNGGGVQFVKDGSGEFRARMSSENYVARNTFSDGSANVGAVAGNDATSATMPGSTKFQVTLVIRSNQLEGWVTPLDGSMAGQAQYLGTISKANMNTNSPWTLVTENTGGFPSVPTHYAAGFVNYQTENSRARADVVNVRSSQDPNVFSVWANDAYVKGSELIEYVLGGANFTDGAYGYQGSLSASGATTVFDFVAPLYPFPQILAQPTTGSLNYAAGVATNAVGPDFDTILASLRMVNPGGNGLASMTALSTIFGSLPARYSDADGSPFPSLSRVSSNLVVVDNTAPTVAPQTLTLQPGTSIPLSGGTMVTGSYRTVVDARDLGASASGLDNHPTYTWDFGNDGSPEIGPLRMNSGTGNAFYADFNVLNSY
ncbi:MAG TPA: hypothetical protein VEX38_04735, partial [Fimbriimonadaceae bacterium]|nr:hypothetical protein [Fimbriimonadaceae bacterium]